MRQSTPESYNNLSRSQDNPLIAVHQQDDLESMGRPTAAGNRASAVGLIGQGIGNKHAAVRRDSSGNQAVIPH